MYSVKHEFIRQLENKQRTVCACEWQCGTVEQTSLLLTPTEDGAASDMTVLSGFEFGTNWN